MTPRSVVLLGAWVPLLTLLVVACGSSPAAAPDAGDEAGPVQEDAAPDEAPPDDAPTQLDAGCSGTATEVDRGLLRRGDALSNVDLLPCTSHRYSVAVPAGTEMRLEGKAASGRSLSLAVTYPDGTDEKIFEGTLPGDGTVVSLTFLSPRSGEFFIRLTRQDIEQKDRYHLTLSCSTSCDLETTLFPIVLVHGWTGWNSIGSYEYFYNVNETLTALGYPVFTATLDPYNSIEVRAGQLQPEVDQVLTDFRARKIDIIAHSQGGLDSRRLITTLGYGDRVSALTTVATPHQGTPICDMAMGYLPGPGLDVLDFMLNAVGAMGGNESDAEASFEAMTQHYVQGTFNPATPDDPRVAYDSWTGFTCDITEDTCANKVHALIAASYWIIKDAAGDNDGIVPVSSAPWGDYHGTVDADHFSEIGQFAGVTGTFEHLEFYKSRARDFAAAGH
jgi:triacylglycerol esterase/lipase EstA (alpha/beta hydrolase family)